MIFEFLILSTPTENSFPMHVLIPYPKMHLFAVVKTWHTALRYLFELCLTTTKQQMLCLNTVADSLQ